MHDPTELTPHEINVMVATARRRGTRKLAIRRVGSSIAAMGLVAGLGLGAFAMLDSTSSMVAPGDQPPPIVESQTPEVDEPQSPAPVEETPTEEPPAEDDGAAADFREESLEAIDVLRSLLPEGVSASLDSLGAPDDLGAVVRLHDEQGEVAAGLWLGMAVAPDLCPQDLGCMIVPVADGDVAVMDGAADGKRGQNRHFTYVRADGASVYLWLDNVRFTGDKDWIETRATLPLTDEQGAALVSDPAWDELLEAVLAAES